MSKSWLALVESNTTGTGRLFVQAAVDLGFSPVLLTADASRYDYIAMISSLKILSVDTGNEERILETCRELSDSGLLAGVTSSSEYFISAAAAVARQLGLPGPDPAAVRHCRDKGIQRERLHAAGIGVPLFAVADSVPAALEAAHLIKLPVVLKPSSGTGSSGVRLCGSFSEVAEHAGNLLGLRENERGLPMLPRVLVEEFISGPEFSVETLDREVIGITEKHLGASPHFVETGHDFPCLLPLAEAESVKRTTIAALSALGLGWGPAHTELRLTVGGPKIIEVNPRLAGGMIPELVRLATNIDMVQETLRAVVGLQRSIPVADDRFVSIRFVVPQQQGCLISVEGLNEVQSMPGVISARIYSRPGTCIRRRGDFRDRIGDVIVGASDYETAKALAAQYVAMIHPIIDEHQNGVEP